MSSYQFAAGNNNAAGLTALATQPKTGIMKRPRERTSGTGLVVADGNLRVDWIFTQITAAQFAALLTAMGIDGDDFSPTSVLATVKTKKNSNDTFANYNAVVTLKSNFSRNYIGREDVVFGLTKLVAL